MQIKAVEQWVRTLPLTAKRGEITDCNGNILAISYTSYDVFIRAKEIDKPVEVCTYLSTLLNLDYSKVYEKTRNVFVSESLIKLQVDEQTANKIINKGFNGVYLSENISRYYPYGKNLSQVLGFLTSDSKGQSGVEKYYEHVLSGVNGKYLTQSDVRGVILDDSLKYYVEAVDGLNIKLNIDINIQVIAENILAEINKEHNPKNASIVVLNPENSKVLALAISPGFDLNNIPRDNISELMERSKNIAVTDVYEPGSTFKILTLSAALSENLTNINERFYCPGYRIVNGEKIKCWKTTGHGSQTLVEAVQNSCNCCFMDLGLRLGKEKLYKYLRNFGIGNKSGIDSTGESGGILLNENNIKDVDLVRIAFGQTVAVSEIQLLNAFCSAINGGKLLTPTLTNSFYDENNKKTFEAKDIVKHKTISQLVVKQIKYLLEQSLSKTGQMSFVDGYRIGGKTGTAQKYGKDGHIARGKYISSFFGFLNQDDKPSYATLLCVNEPSSGAYYGSVVAKPYAKKLFQKIIEYKGLEPDDKTKKPQEIIVPEFIGKSVQEAVKELEKLGMYYEVDGEGEKVLNQFPSKGISCNKGVTILLKA